MWTEEQQQHVDSITADLQARLGLAAGLRQQLETALQELNAYEHSMRRMVASQAYMEYHRDGRMETEVAKNRLERLCGAASAAAKTL
jgi:hypothetical protein